jgi:hypothetical protein
MFEIPRVEWKEWVSSLTKKQQCIVSFRDEKKGGLPGVSILAK